MTRGGGSCMSLGIEVPAGLAEIAVFACLSTLAVVFGFLAVKSRDSVYAALSLAFVGSSVAGLIALMGFGYLAAFHLVIYVGAAVIFLTFTVLMLREPPAEFREMRLAALVNAVALATILYMLLRQTFLGNVELKENLSEVSALIFGKYWLAFLALVYSLATVVIEAIVVARGERR